MNRRVPTAGPGARELARQDAAPRSQVMLARPLQPSARGAAHEADRARAASAMPPVWGGVQAWQDTCQEPWPDAEDDPDPTPRPPIGPPAGDTHDATDDEFGAGAGADRSLFRRQAQQALLPQSHGEIVLEPGASARWSTLLALLLLAGLVALLALGSYTRRSTVVGRLAPDAGQIAIISMQAGVVVELNAAEGRQVRQGEVLAVLSGERLGPGQQELQRDIASQIALRRSSLEGEVMRSVALESRELAQLQRRQQGLAAEQQRVQSQIQLQEQRVEAASEAMLRWRALFEQGFVSRDQLSQRETDLSDHRGRVQALQRELLVLKRETEAGLREIDATSNRYATQRTEAGRTLALLRQELAETEARRRFAVTAPASGRLTLVQARIGQTVEPMLPLAQLIPGSATLQARLYAPSRAAGFTRPGDAVLLRYDAYPYQKFGQHHGRVLAVSDATVPVSEAQAALGAEAATEPMFAITVALPAQQVQGAGVALPLQTGMRVQAELLHETRRLYEWAIEPLLALRARSAGPGAAP